VPAIFIRSSDDEYSEHESSFVILFYEKSIRKRTFAKSQTQKQRLARLLEIKKASVVVPFPPRVLEDLMPNRDSKMRRFCNYFLTLFNQKKLNPFTQFVNSTTLKIVKHNVRIKMQYFTKGGTNEGKKKKPKAIAKDGDA
jgi:hypothetical protein